MLKTISFNTALVSFVLCVCPSVVLAQTPPNAEEDAKEPVINSTVDQRGGFFNSGILVNLGSADSKVTGTFSKPLVRGNFKQLDLSLSIETSIDSASKRADFVTDFDLNGDLAASVGVAYKFAPKKWEKDVTNHFRLVSGDRAAVRDASRRAQLMCESFVERQGGLQGQTLNSPQVEKEKNENCRGKDRTFWLKAENSKFLSEADNRLMKNYERDEKRIRDRSFRFIGAEAKVGRDKQSYRSVAQDFKALSDTKTPYGFSAYYGVIPSVTDKKLQTYFFGVSHEVEYEASDSRTLCRAEMDDTPIECFSASFEAPEKEEKTSVYGLTRYQKNFNIAGTNFPIGIEVKLAYDLTDDDFGVEVPVYLTADEDGNLVSGIRFRYDEGDDEDFGVGFFVGQKFDLFGTGG